MMGNAKKKIAIAAMLMSKKRFNLLSPLTCGLDASLIKLLCGEPKAIKGN
jgi:hypothetical protein